MKMRFYVLLLFLSLAFIIFSCRTGISDLYPESITFNNERVNHIHLTGGEKLELSPPVQISRFSTLDTLLIISGQSTINDFGLHIYSLQTGSHIASFAKLGRGPDENQYVFDFQLSRQSKKVFFFDLQTGRSRLYSIDSILVTNNPHPLETISFGEKNFEVLLKLNKEEYLCNFFRPGANLQKAMLQKVQHPSFRVLKKSGFPPLEQYGSALGYNHLNQIFYSFLSFNETAGKIVVSYFRTDLIEVYDTDLNRLVRVHGPDRTIPVFSFGAGMTMGANNKRRGNHLPQSPVDNILFTPLDNRLCYQICVVTDNGFFVAYNGALLPVDLRNRVYAESVYYFNYDGLPVCRYTFDIGGFGLSHADYEEEHIYITDPMGDLFVYSLK